MPGQGICTSPWPPTISSHSPGHIPCPYGGTFLISYMLRPDTEPPRWVFLFSPWASLGLSKTVSGSCSGLLSCPGKMGKGQRGEKHPLPWGSPISGGSLSREAKEGGFDGCLWGRGREFQLMLLESGLFSTCRSLWKQHPLTEHHQPTAAPS